MKRGDSVTVLKIIVYNVTNANMFFVEGQQRLNLLGKVEQAAHE